MSDVFRTCLEEEEQPAVELWEGRGRRWREGGEEMERRGGGGDRGLVELLKGINKERIFSICLQ